MATSGNTIVQYTRNELITAALGTLGVLARGQDPDSEDITKAAIKFNMLVAKLRTMQLPLWKRTNYTLTLTASVNSYTFGDGQAINTPYPLKLLEAYSVSDSNTINLPMDILSNSDFNLLPTSTSSGQPLQCTYQPKNNLGVLKIWPTPDATAAADYTVLLVYQAPFEYFDASTNTMDFPEEYYLPLVYELAVLLAPDWGIPIEDRRELKKELKEMWADVQSFGEEEGSWFFQMDRRR